MKEWTRNKNPAKNNSFEHVCAEFQSTEQVSVLKRVLNIS